MGTLVNNNADIAKEKSKKPKLTQLQKLQKGLKCNDLSLIVYTNKCDALGGECACGKKGIVYRFFVKNPDGEIFVVGSECINHFIPAVQDDIRTHEKQLKSKVQAEKRKQAKIAQEKAKQAIWYKNGQPLRDQIYELMKHPLIQDMMHLWDAEHYNPAVLKDTIYRIKDAIRTREERRNISA